MPKLGRYFPVGLLDLGPERRLPAHRHGTASGGRPVRLNPGLRSAYLLLPEAEQRTNYEAVAFVQLDLLQHFDPDRLRLRHHRRILKCDGLR